MRFENESEALIPALQLAAQLTSLVRQEYVIAARKAQEEPVTIADFGSQAIICRAIRDRFPNDAVVSEERAEDFLNAVEPEQQALILKILSEILEEPVTEEMICEWLDHGKDRTSGRTWAIDPIDGTRGFLGGRRYTIAAALLVDGQVSFSVMACPEYERLSGKGLVFYAMRDNGTYALPLDGAYHSANRVGASRKVEPTEARGVESVVPQHADHEALQSVREQMGASEANVVRVDGQEKYASVAVGDAEYYLRVSPARNRLERIWDHAAGALMVEEAGGRVTDLDGKPLDFSTGMGAKRVSPLMIHNRGIIASNDALHERLVQAVKAAGV